MKKSSIVRLCFGLLLGVLTLAACTGQKDKQAAAQHEHAEQPYTCPMHPQVVQDGPGTCPICGMDLVPQQAAVMEGVQDSSLAHLLKPVNEQVVATTPTIRPESGTRILSMEVQGSISYDTRRQTSLSSRVAGRIERLAVKYNYQPVRKGQLIMEIYSPDLAAAQRELLYLQRTDPGDNMLAKAKQRLLLLGMTEGQISQVLRSGRILYRVPVYSPVSGYILEQSAAVSPAASQNPMPATPTASGDGMNGMGNGAAGAPPATTGTPATTTPVLLREGQYVGAGQSLFTLYREGSLVAEFAFDPALAPEVQKGQKLVFHKTADPEVVYSGTIGLIQPTFRAGNNFTLARVYLTDTRFQIGQLVTASLPIVSRGWWVPQSAVVALGSRSVVFKKEAGVFVPREVPVRLRAKGLVLIEEGIGDWEIARSAAYLVDSESFIELNSNQQTEEP